MNPTACRLATSSRLDGAKSSASMLLEMSMAMTIAIPSCLISTGPRRSAGPPRRRSSSAARARAATGGRTTTPAAPPRRDTDIAVGAAGPPRRRRHHQSGKADSRSSSQGRAKSCGTTWIRASSSTPRGERAVGPGDPHRAASSAERGASLAQRRLARAAVGEAGRRRRRARRRAVAAPGGAAAQPELRRRRGQHRPGFAGFGPPAATGGSGGRSRRGSAAAARAAATTSAAAPAARAPAPSSDQQGNQAHGAARHDPRRGCGRSAVSGTRGQHARDAERDRWRRERVHRPSAASSSGPGT